MRAGLADPAPVAQTFFMEENLRKCASSPLHIISG